MKVVHEAVPLLEAQTVRVLDLSLDAFVGPVHAHPLLELTWISKGTGLRLLGDSVEPFGEGDLVLVSPMAPHAWWTSGPQPNGVAAVVMQVRLSSALSALPEWHSGVGQLLNEPASAWVLAGHLAEEVRSSLESLPAARGLGQLGVGMSILDKISRCTDQVVRRPVGLQAPRHERRSSNPERRIEGLLTWVKDHFHEEVQIATAAAQLHVSPAAFSRAFKRLVGRPFVDYINDLRIAEACLLLRRTDRPITEIAAACGLPTLSNFNVQFRRRIGVSPREYRHSVGG